MTPPRINLITPGLADPDGHVRELAHNPFRPLDAEGRLTGAS